MLHSIDYIEKMIIVSQPDKSLVLHLLVLQQETAVAIRDNPVPTEKVCSEFRALILLHVLSPIQPLTRTVTGLVAGIKDTLQ